MGRDAIFAATARYCVVAVWCAGAMGITVNFTAGGAHAVTARDAMEFSRQAGRPILAIAGRASCPPCRGMKHMLDDDESLQPLLRRYVVMKMDVDGENFQWFQEHFPSQFDSIPQVFVVRPDGVLLYEAAGALDAAAMKDLLQRSLDASGLPLSEQQQQAAAEALRLSSQAQAEGRLEDSLEFIAKYVEMESYATAIVAARQLHEEISGRLRAEIDDARVQLESKTPSVASAIRLLQIQRGSRASRPVAEHARQALRSLRTYEQAGRILIEAKDLVLARWHEDQRQFADAESHYLRVVRRNLDREATQYAQQRLATLRTVTDKLETDPYYASRESRERGT